MLLKNKIICFICASSIVLSYSCRIVQGGNSYGNSHNFGPTQNLTKLNQTRRKYVAYNLGITLDQVNEYIDNNPNKVLLSDLQDYVDKNGLSNDSNGWLGDALPGLFSVSKNKKVKFSKGNLYHYGNDSQKGWGLEENQYDFRSFSGGEAIVDGEMAKTAKNDTGFFYWTNKTADAIVDPDKFVYKATSSDDVFFANSDSAVIGEDWYCLSGDEWFYLLEDRDGAKSKRAVCCVRITSDKHVWGLVLLPDDWNCPEGINFKGCDSFNLFYLMATEKTEMDEMHKYGKWNMDSNYYTVAEWQKMEKAGAVLLPYASDVLVENGSLSKSLDSRSLEFILKPAYQGWGIYRSSSLSKAIDHCPLVADHWINNGKDHEGGSWYFGFGYGAPVMRESCVDTKYRYAVRLVKNSK